MTIEDPVPGPPTGLPGVSGHPHPGDWSSLAPDAMLSPLAQKHPFSPIMQVPLPLMSQLERPNLREADTAEITCTSTEEIRAVRAAQSERLSRRLAALEAAISVCERNLAAIAHGEKEITSEGARYHYSQAEVELKEKRSHLLGMRERVYQLAVNMNCPLEQTMHELSVGVESRANQGVNRKPPKQPAASKTATPQRNRKPPRKDAELDVLAEIDLHNNAIDILGIDPESVKKAAKEQ